MFKIMFKKPLDSTTTRQAHSINDERRHLLRLIPAGIFAAITGAITITAFRFLHPLKTITGTNEWTNVAMLSELTGDAPVMRRIAIARSNSWAGTFEAHTIYVLPKQNNIVVSGVCPHENCDIAWRDDTRKFFCPCHRSTFAENGARLSGPARRGLDPLPQRVRDGVLQVQFQSFVNNTEERIVRG